MACCSFPVLLDEAALHPIDDAQAPSGQLEEIAGSDGFSGEAAARQDDAHDASTRGGYASKSKAKKKLTAVTRFAREVRGLDTPAPEEILKPASVRTIGDERRILDHSRIERRDGLG